MYEWIESGDLPAHRINDQFRINRSELLEWATQRNIAVAPALFHEDEEDERIPSVAESLGRGGVFHDVPGATREEVLRSIVALLKVEDEGDRETLLDLFLARGAGAVVPVGDGIAIPHVRNPIALAADEISLTLCFLRKPVDVAVPDGPIFALFFLVSPTTRAHLKMLAKIAFLLRDPRFRGAIGARVLAARAIEVSRIVDPRVERPMTSLDHRRRLGARRDQRALRPASPGGIETRPSGYRDRPARCRVCRRVRRCVLGPRRRRRDGRFPRS